MTKHLTLLLFIWLATGCENDNSNYHKIEHIKYEKNYAIFYFSDGRIYRANSVDNTNWEYLDEEDIVNVESVLFREENEILLQGTQEDGFFIKKGRIPLIVKRIK